MVMSLPFEHHPLLLPIEWFSKIFKLEPWGIAILPWTLTGIQILENGQNFMNSLSLPACLIAVTRLEVTVNKVAIGYLYNTINS